MAICISGNIDPDRTIEIIEKIFFIMEKPEALRPEPKWEEKPHKGREFVQVQYLGEEQVLLAFRPSQISLNYPAFAWLIWFWTIQLRVWSI